MQEVTINYTKVLTIGNNTISISNLQILDRDLTNYIVESRRNFSLYCYTFEIGFDHNVSTDKIAAIFGEVFERFVHTLPKPPYATLTRSDAFTRVYTVYLYVEHPEDVFTLKPQISEEVFKRWDVQRNIIKTLPPERERWSAAGRRRGSAFRARRAPSAWAESCTARPSAWPPEPAPQESAAQSSLASMIERRSRASRAKRRAAAARLRRF